tara:strand:- start:305 stop:817 length:513 start_codon:yes stop_codon:yes gene_type:complete
MAKSLSQINRDVRRKIQSAARHSAVEIMNDLAEAGPNWRGRFKNSWVADAPGSAIGSKSSYPYSIRNVAKLKDTVAAANQEIKLRVYNATNYALIAQDLVEGRFIKVGRPKGKVVKEGERQENIRGNIEVGDGNNESTASLDWFMNYLDGGGLLKSLESGVRIGFKRGIE